VSARILLIEDEQAIADSIAYALENEGFKLDVVDNGSVALGRARTTDYDLMVLDLLRPGTPGIDVCRMVRASSDLPILIVTARDAEVDRVLGLEIGADDYITKPFSMRELVSRRQRPAPVLRSAGRASRPHLA
jgi:DNA-binding response OmpR family regulator